jgi:hypothetical protein
MCISTCIYIYMGFVCVCVCAFFFFFKDWVSLCWPGWSQILGLKQSSRGAGTIGMNHCTQLRLYFCVFFLIYLFLLLIYFLIFVVLEFKLRASHLLGRHFAAWATPQVLFFKKQNFSLGINTKRKKKIKFSQPIETGFMLWLFFFYFILFKNSFHCSRMYFPF